MREKKSLKTVFRKLNKNRSRISQNNNNNCQENILKIKNRRSIVSTMKA